MTVHYFNTVTNKSRWDTPPDFVATAVEDLQQEVSEA